MRPLSYTRRINASAITSEDVQRVKALLQLNGAKVAYASQESIVFGMGSFGAFSYIFKASITFLTSGEEVTARVQLPLGGILLATLIPCAVIAVVLVAIDLPLLIAALPPAIIAVAALQLSVASQLLNTILSGIGATSASKP